MKVCMMQPTFLPWVGYFELISKCDQFVFLDDFQFSIQSYHQRNRLFVNKEQVDWYTAPVKRTSFLMPLNETQTNEEIPWRSKLWKRIQQNYGKARYFKTYEEVIRKWLLTPARSLADQNIAFIKMICSILGFRTPFRYSSEYPSQLHRSERVLELLRECNSDHYLCARGSFNYMVQDKVFPVEDIVILFQNHHPVSYDQVGSPGKFVPYLSILDVLFNVGPEETSRLIMDGTKEWHDWSAMLSLSQEVEENDAHCDRRAQYRR
ncbi:MAG: hypothetical protein C4576_20375 [Desulfobacteraceae bacterium]|nr:MAG: hypothetical protein C4576_20375 [Desulfobacteraceae bacterium]